MGEQSMVSPSPAAKIAAPREPSSSPLSELVTRIVLARRGAESNRLSMAAIRRSWREMMKNTGIFFKNLRNIIILFSETDQDSSFWRKLKKIFQFNLVKNYEGASAPLL